MLSRAVTGLSLVLAIFGSPSAVAQPTTEVLTPPMASGHSRGDPDQITTADVLARAVLLSENLALIRAYMGAAPAQPPLVRGRDATMDEAYFGALSLSLRIERLAFEQLRTEQTRGPPNIPRREVVAADTWRVVDRALATLIKVKRRLGITTEPPERLPTGEPTPTDVFNLLLTTVAEVDEILERRVQGENAYVVATVLVHQSMVLHLAHTKKMMPNEPAFVPNKTPEDVFAELMACFELVGKISGRVGLPVVTVERDPSTSRAAVLNDLVDLSVLLIAELDRLIITLGHERTYLRALAPGRKYPSHVLARVGLLKAILNDLTQAKLPRKAP